jgi:hypothetical protein
MKSINVLLIVSVALLSLVPAVAADISGKWESVITTPIGDMNYTFDFKVEGEKLTGKALMNLL